MEILVYLAIIAVSYAVQMALRPTPDKPKPASLEDFEVPVIEEGVDLKVLFGRGWVTGPSVIDYGNLRTTEIKSDGGKK